MLFPKNIQNAILFKQSTIPVTCPVLLTQITLIAENI